MSAPESCLHVLIADSAQLRLQLIAGALSRRPDFRVSRCNLSANAMLAFLHGEMPDVVLVNLEQYGSCAEELDCVPCAPCVSAVPIVLLVSNYGRELVAAGFRAGACGIFCFAVGDFRAFCKCLHCVYKGQVWANSEQLRMLLESIGQSAFPRVATYTGNVAQQPRTTSVALVAEGFSNGQLSRNCT